jgi:hypothetical protein
MNNTLHDDTAVIAAVEQILGGYQPASFELGESHDDGVLPSLPPGDGDGAGLC